MPIAKCGFNLEVQLKTSLSLLSQAEELVSSSSEKTSSTHQSCRRAFTGSMRAAREAGYSAARIEIS
ncbi:MAG: hypothetical protein ACREBC_23590, partial [Pyrinomonadaceae bacterium]